MVFSGRDAGDGEVATRFRLAQFGGMKELWITLYWWKPR